MSTRPLPIILALGTTQTLAWASSMYLPAILADPMARDLGVSANWVFAAFSAALGLSALLAGFASTVGWPLSAWGLETIGWRNTCFAWAAAHILIGLPLNWLMLPG